MPGATWTHGSRAVTWTAWKASMLRAIASRASRRTSGRASRAAASSVAETRSGAGTPAMGTSPPPNRAFAARRAASPPRRTSSTIARAPSRTSDEALALRSASAARSVTEQAARRARRAGAKAAPRDELLDGHHEDARRPGRAQRREHAPYVRVLDHGVDGDHVVVGERDDARRGEPGQDRLDGAERSARCVHHQVLPAPAGDDRAEHRHDLVDRGVASRHGRGPADQHGLALEQTADRGPPVNDRVSA